MTESPKAVIAAKSQSGVEEGAYFDEEYEECVFFFFKKKRVKFQIPLANWWDL